jgi:predicted transport protein
MTSIDQAFKTMIDNLHKNTGKSLEQWIEIVNQKKFAKHGEIIKYLKEEHAFSHGFANLVAHRSKGSDAQSADDTNELIEKQYKGKEQLRPLYKKLMAEILKFGNDIEVAPKIAYVSLRRKKQFALLQPATKTRFEIGLILKGQEPKGVLEVIPTANAMCSHKINIEKESEITKEVLDWIFAAYTKAG